MGFIRDLINNVQRSEPSRRFMKDIVTGSLYKVSNLKGNSDLSDIRSLIDTMRELAKDSQVSTALSYYATDATTPNSAGDIIWATDIDDNSNSGTAELVNALFRRWNVNNYARDHILELATVGNLYIPTTEFYNEYTQESSSSRMYVGLDTNDIPDNAFDIVPSHKIDPRDIVHIWSEYKPYGFVYDPQDPNDAGYYNQSDYTLFPESAVIHFSLGGLVGDYSLKAKNSSGDDIEYDIQFADPLMKSAVQPTQTLNLLEDATVLSSLIKVVRFICVDCNGVDEEEIMPTLQNIKSIIEQQMSINTGSGDIQSFLNPQSPNNLIYIPRVNGNDPISIIDLNMKDDSEGNDKLLDYYQDKKLSVLGIPKEALNFSSSEGLGGAGAVMSQRSALYANSLQRIEMAYINGWKDAINKYLIARNMYNQVNKFELHMNPILTEMSTVQFDKRDSALSQASAIVELLESLGNKDEDNYKDAITEILLEALPKTSSKVSSWDVDLDSKDSEEF